MAPEGNDKLRLHRFGQQPQGLNTQIWGVGVLDYRFAGMFGPAKFVLQTHEGVIRARYGDQVPPDVEPVTVSWMPQAHNI